MIALLLIALDPILHALGLAQIGLDPHTAITPALPVIAEVERWIGSAR